MNAVRPPAMAVLEAVGKAWNTAHLYPDPRGKPPFQAALAVLAEHAGKSISFEVEQDGFTHDGEPVDVGHPAVPKLARALFLRNVGSWALLRAPGEEELVAFLHELASDAPSDLIDFGTRLEVAQVTAFKILDRASLVERKRSEGDEEPGVERSAEVDAILAVADDPAAVADLVLRTIGDGVEAGTTFAAHYRGVLAALEDQDWVGHEKVVGAFVDAFMVLPSGARVAALEVLLPDRTDLDVRMFLDQFAARELAALSGLLSGEAFAMLLDYSRVVSDEEGGDADLLDLLEGQTAQQAQQAVAARVHQRIKDMQRLNVSAGSVATELAAEVASLRIDELTGVEVLRVLFAVEQRPHRLRRLLRIWSGKVTGAIRALDFTTALAWIEGLEQGISHLPTRTGRLDEAFEMVATPEVVAVLTSDLSDLADDSPRRRLLEILGRHATGRLVEVLGAEDDAGRRRALIEVLAAVARVDPAPVVAFLGDSRWFVVRNLAIALGRSGRPHAGPGLVKLTRHPEPRVRVEALRAMIPCLGRNATDHLIAALTDREERVRSTAASLLGALRGDDQWKRLRDALERDDLDTHAKLMLVRLLAQEPGDGATGALVELAESRARRGEGRALKEAARSLLDGRRISA